MEKIRFDKKEREKIISAKVAEGLVLVEEWNHVDGDFMFFLPAEETKPAKKEDPITELKKRLDAVEADVGTLKKAVKAAMTRKDDPPGQG